MGNNKREVAAAILIGERGNLLLQLRDDKPGLLFAGMIGLFGGHREKPESFRDCVRREVEEETGLQMAKEDFEPLVKYRTRYPDGARVKGSYYILRNVPETTLEITEGSLISILPEDLPSYFTRMTPATAFVIKTWLDLERGRD